jgi:hypothetical protein
VRLLWKSEAGGGSASSTTPTSPWCAATASSRRAPALSDTGEHVFEVGGNADRTIHLSCASTSPDQRQSTSRQRPDDELTEATTLDPAVGIMVMMTCGRGRIASVDGDPQQVDLAGEHIDSLSWVRHSRTELEQASLAADGTSARLEDLSVPGEHWFSVRRRPQYSLGATPLVHRPDGEREPNGGRCSQKLHRQRKVGHLASPGDDDVYRFRSPRQVTCASR